MSLLMFNGFESGDPDAVGGVDAVVSAVQARTGTYAMRAPNGGDTIEVTVTPGAGESVIFGFGLYLDLMYAADIISIKKNGISDFMRLVLTSGGSISVGFDNSTTGSPSQPVATLDAGTLTAKTWHYIEIEWLPSTTVGIARVRIDGDTPGGWTDIDTGDTSVSASAGDGSYTLKCYFASGSLTPAYMDDVYALDTAGAAPFNAFLGAVSIEMLSPDGDVESDFVGSDANSVDNRLLIDELPMDTTDYVESATATNRELVDLTAKTLGGLPLAVRTIVYGRDSDGGSQSVDILTKSGVTENADIQAMPSVDGVLSVIHPLDPNGSIAWTETTVNAVQVGVEVN